MTATSAREICKRLRTMAEVMTQESFLKSRRHTPNRLCMRYGPFIRELSNRAIFCRELSEMRLIRWTPVNEDVAAWWKLLTKYRFPSEPPYDVQFWHRLLTVPLLGEPTELAILFMGIESIEVQFAYSGSIPQMLESVYHFPIIEAASVPFSSGMTSNEFMALVDESCLPKLEVFRRRTKELMWRALSSRFEARLLIFSDISPLQAPAPGSKGNVKTTVSNPVFRSAVSTSFSTSFQRRRHTRTTLKEILSSASKVLEAELALVPGSGRPPRTEKNRPMVGSHGF